MTILTDPNKGKLRHQLFTSSGTWTVPAGVYVIWVDAVSGGGGGAGGYASAVSGGGGAGGQPGQGVRNMLLEVTPGATLTITVGAGGAGGAVGMYGNATGTVIDGLSILNKSTLFLGPIGQSSPGLVDSGGQSNYSGAGSGSNELIYKQYGGGAAGYANIIDAVTLRGSGWGGAPGVNGSFSGTYGSALNPEFYGTAFSVGGAAVGQLGGGGAGGHGPWGVGGGGGNGGVAGENGVGYGSGGGGGGCNAPGGNGAPGFVRIYWQA